MHIKKALTFRASSIGDCLMGKYLLENIHQAYPEAKLGIVVGSRSAMIRDLFSAYPWIEVVEANRRDVRSLWKLWHDWHGTDLIVTQYAGKPDGRFSFASKVIARLLAYKGKLIGFTDASRLGRLFYNVLTPFDISVAPAELERRALRASGVGVVVESPRMQFITTPDIQKKFDIQKPFIVVHLFAGNKGRGLSPENERSLISALEAKLPEYQLVISGGASDREEAEEVAQGTSARVVAGKTTLQELMNLIAESSVVVSVDTGAAHLSAQLGTPLVVLRTCLGPNWWLPEQYGDSSSIRQFSREDLCSTKHQYSNSPVCINEINMLSVAEAVRNELNSLES